MEENKMAESKQEIINSITDHFKGKTYGNCYIGITKDINDRLFNAHGVSKEKGFWIYHTASSDTIAREVEKYFIDKGMDGGDGGGDENSKIIYAYHKTSSTKP